MSKILYFIALAMLLTACTKDPDDNVPGTNDPNGAVPPITNPEGNPPNTSGNGDMNNNGTNGTNGMKAALGTHISIKNSKNASDATGNAQADVVMTAVNFDSSGKIASAYIDNAQVKINFDKSGKIVSELTEMPKTKKQLGDAYGMKKASSIGKEWWEQIEAFEKYVVGKNISELQTMKVKERDETHKFVPDVPELTASVTISVEDYVAALANAEQNSKKQ